MSQDLIVAHIPALRRYARALTDNTWAADDLVQDTLERACNKWRLWLVGSNLRAWLFSVMHNLFINQLRQAPQHAGLTQTEFDEVAGQLQAPASGSDQLLDLQRCLLQLPPEQREVLLLVSLEDMSYAEAAKVTGVAVGTVMSRLSRARTRLQDLLDAPVRSVPDGAAKCTTTPRVATLHRLK
ncbi:MAG: RNA polymerase subunit sigma-24 [Comamonadaceae bacterium CG1_02_60_18]|nr:MAG: RNA polymerase subunit sigma-24 [Comamonadaceae bacterium CG1_02_60_18]PIQ53916.1 MAG: RNA polymerase subunit sigma-24 [Comamonadaceae bacterium CG12_big_fil_rev_8_21_14_0_65_59_15]